VTLYSHREKSYRKDTSREAFSRSNRSDISIRSTHPSADERGVRSSKDSMDVQVHSAGPMNSSVTSNWGSSYGRTTLSAKHNDVSEQQGGHLNNSPLNGQPKQAKVKGNSEESPRSKSVPVQSRSTPSRSSNSVPRGFAALGGGINSLDDSGTSSDSSGDEGGHNRKKKRAHELEVDGRTQDEPAKMAIDSESAAISSSSKTTAITAAAKGNDGSATSSSSSSSSDESDSDDGSDSSGSGGSGSDLDLDEDLLAAQIEAELTPVSDETSMALDLSAEDRKNSVSKKKIVEIKNTSMLPAFEKSPAKFQNRPSGSPKSSKRKAESQGANAKKKRLPRLSVDVVKDSDSEGTQERTKEGSSTVVPKEASGKKVDGPFREEVKLSSKKRVIKLKLPSESKNAVMDAKNTTLAESAATVAGNVETQKSKQPSLRGTKPGSLKDNSLSSTSTVKNPSSRGNGEKIGSSRSQRSDSDVARSSRDRNREREEGEYTDASTRGTSREQHSKSGQADKRSDEAGSRVKSPNTTRTPPRSSSGQEKKARDLDGSSTTSLNTKGPISQKISRPVPPKSIGKKPQERPSVSPSRPLSNSQDSRYPDLGTLDTHDSTSPGTDGQALSAMSSKAEHLRSPAGRSEFIKSALEDTDGEHQKKLTYAFWESLVKPVDGGTSSAGIAFDP
jgi:hypothetical protein